jgi:hypothetical protein
MVNGRLLLASRKLCLGAVSVLAVAIYGYAQVGAQTSNEVLNTLPVRQLELLQLTDGDLVFRTGRDVMARLVLSQGESPRFSHVGLVVKQSDGIFVVHALPHDGIEKGGVLIEPLSQFASAENAVDVGFYRALGIDAISREKIRTYALSQIGKPFDDEFKFSDDSNIYCTELALKALNAAGINLQKSIQHVTVLTLTEPVFPPDHMRRSARLEPVTPNTALQGTLRDNAAQRP